MALPESFKFDVRVRERLLRSGELTESEIEKHLEKLPDAAQNAITIELKQPAFQTEAERAENAVVVKAAPPRPITLAAPINLDEEEDEDDEEELPKKVAPKLEAERAEKAEPAGREEEDADDAADTADDDDEDDDEDEDDEDDDGDGDEGEEELSGSGSGESGEDS